MLLDGVTDTKWRRHEATLPRAEIILNPDIVTAPMASPSALWLSVPSVI